MVVDEDLPGQDDVVRGGRDHVSPTRFVEATRVRAPLDGRDRTLRHGCPAPGAEHPVSHRQLFDGPRCLGVEMRVPGRRHWSLSPTTSTLWCAPEQEDSSFCAGWCPGTRRRGCGGSGGGTGRALAGTLQQVDGGDQQVVEVHGGGEQASWYSRRCRRSFARRSADLLGVVLGAEQLVLGRRDGGVDRRGGKRLGSTVEIPRRALDEANGVGLVVDRERRLVAEPVGVARGGSGRTPSGTWTPTSPRPPGRPTPRPAAHLAGRPCW